MPKHSTFQKARVDDDLGWCLTVAAQTFSTYVCLDLNADMNVTEVGEVCGAPVGLDIDTEDSPSLLHFRKQDAKGAKDESSRGRLRRSGWKS